MRRRVEVSVSRDAPVDPLVGRVLEDRYEVTGRIARGGMATVYRARDRRLQRDVAVKVMHLGMGDDGAFAKRFVREARAVAKLSHPNVVAVYDQGEDGGSIFLAMELIEGSTLRETILDRAPVAPSQALALIEPVLSALAAAHRTGVIHRDIKPENVLIADDGRIKVADFGLAKAIDSATAHSATTGSLLGTVSYVAPEILTEGRADARSDVYSAGVLLYELLTGRKPHEGENPMQVAYSHVNSDVPHVSDTVDGVPDYVDALVARATARDPAQRPADAAVLLQHVHRVRQALGEGLTADQGLAADLAPHRVGSGTADLLADVPRATPAPAPVPVPPARRPRPAKPRRRRRGLLILLLALLLAVGGGVSAYWYGVARYTSAPAVIGLTQAEAEARLTDLDFDVTLGDSVYSETVPEGSVVDSDPEAGSRVLREGSVTLVLSLGKERYDVPKLRGSTEDEAQDALLATKLEFKESLERFSEKVPEGEVIGSEPRAGTTLRPGAAVTLILSKGRRPIEVGDWIGEPISDVRSAYSERGLGVRVTSEEFDDTVPRGSVISQDPVGGTLFRGDEVSFVVSKGPELVEVPSIRGFGVSAAREELVEAGFDVEIEARIGNPLGFVISTDPAAGERVPKGSTITLFIV